MTNYMSVYGYGDDNVRQMKCVTSERRKTIAVFLQMARHRVTGNNRSIS